MRRKQGKKDPSSDPFHRDLTNKTLQNQNQNKYSKSVAVCRTPTTLRRTALNSGLESSIRVTVRPSSCLQLK
ncbi:hypothetical protein RDI58_006334 [Solanum bulbocastanum]|uniref:Uncharacterized protein n=1 Tax=Solanum bulbocastanum TaxID=147425 RepID=A0AAN8U8M7_SOLBU